MEASFERDSQRTLFISSKEPIGDWSNNCINLRTGQIQQVGERPSCDVVSDRKGGLTIASVSRDKTAGCN